MEHKQGGASNRLAGEKSPYLLQHAHNPVDWYPWGEEAFRKAKNDGKPILLSIGYSTCHWCHVMAGESFEDKATAAVINKNFIPIKVDREERPEVDAYYMGAVQSMTGGGGWPLTVFLTPDLKPFYGGTYFPAAPRYGMPSFTQVLEFVAGLWKEKRGEVLQNSSQVAAALSEATKGSAKEPKKEAIEDGAAALLASFDPEQGGFGGAPKFPLPLASGFLLRYQHRTGKELALKGVTKTLDGMLAGGIRDHVGGGFHRYSTDRVWLVPHFEKMLYDNALLARVYTEAFQVTGAPRYGRVAREALDWMLGEMRDGLGGFYSAQDADSPEGEGAYYTWTPDELKAALGEGPALEFAAAYGVTQNGNFDGRSILHLSGGPRSEEELGGKSMIWKKRLYEERVKRPRPATDTKVLTSWNGLAISSFAFAGKVLGEPRYLKAAKEASDFILSRCVREGRLLRRYADGESALAGTLEDYAFFVQGLLDLFEATGEPEKLEEAVRLANVMIQDFGDQEAGGFFLTVEAVPARLKEGYDGPTPSGNSVAVMDLVRLSELTGNAEFRAQAEKTLSFFGEAIEKQPTAHANFLMGMDMLVNGVSEVVLASPSAEGLNGFEEVVWGTYFPNKAVVPATSKTFERLAKSSALLEGRKPGARPRAYLCVGFACKLPADSPEVLARQLAGR